MWNWTHWMCHTQVIPTLFLMWRSNEFEHLASRCGPTRGKTSCGKSDTITFPPLSEKARGLLSRFSRSITPTDRSTEHEDSVRLSCGPSRLQAGRGGVRWWGVPVNCSQQGRNQQVMRQGDGSAHYWGWGMVAIRRVFGSWAVKIYSWVWLLFPTLIKSINLFHF